MKCDDPISGKRSLRLIAWMAIHRPHYNRWGLLVICMLLLGFGQTGSMFLPPAVVDLVDSILCVDVICRWYGAWYCRRSILWSSI